MTAPRRRWWEPPAAVVLTAVVLCCGAWLRHPLGTLGWALVAGVTVAVTLRDKKDKTS
jgi:hypothetical protein